MEELLHELIASFDSSPSVRGRELRELAEQDWNEFTTASLALLAEDCDSHGARFLVALLLRNGTLVDAICASSPFSISKAAPITRIASGLEVHFDIHVARRATPLPASEEHQAGRILKIFEESSGGPRLQPFLGQLVALP